MFAVVTAIPVTAQCRGTTQRQLGQRTLDLWGGLLTVALDVLGRGDAKDLGNT
jgi:hypothetical protein